MEEDHVTALVVSAGAGASVWAEAGASLWSAAPVSSGGAARNRLLEAAAAVAGTRPAGTGVWMEFRL